MAACCAPETEATCCAPEAKGACCGTAAAGGSCGCAAGRSVPEPTDIRETVRERYAAAARAAAAALSRYCCDEPETNVAGALIWGGGL